MKPRLRFSGFNSEWQQIRLGDFVDFKNGKPHEDDIVAGGRYELITINSIGTDGNLKSSKKHVASDDGSLLKDDIIVILSDIAHGYLLGMSDLVPESGKYVLNQRVGRVRVNKSYSPAFTRLAMNKKQLFFRNRGQGTSQRHIYERDINSLLIFMPEIYEQKKIASFISTVDARILNQKVRISKLKRYKSVVMKKILYQDIGFKNKDGIHYQGWTEVSLGDIAHKENSSISANEIVGRSGKYKVFGAGGFLQLLDRYDQESEYISIVKDGAGVGRLMLCEPQSSVLSTLSVIKAKDGIDTKFLYALMSTINFRKYSIGSTIPHVYFSHYAKERFNLPSFVEQQKIAALFTSLEEKIALEEKMSTQLKKFRQSLLQRMFM